MSKITIVTTLLHTTTKISPFHANGYGDRTNEHFVQWKKPHLCDEEEQEYQEEERFLQ